MSHKLCDLLGDTLIRCGSGEKVFTKSLCGKEKIVALYFAAEWCPPCKGFTPKLQEFYNNFKNGKCSCPGVAALEIVYVSWDKDEAGFDDSVASMSWVALPFEAKEKKVSWCITVSSFFFDLMGFHAAFNFECDAVLS